MSASLLWLSVVVVLALLASPSTARTDNAGASSKADVISKRITGQWSEMLRICSNRTYVSCSGADRSRWTDAAKTAISDVQLGPLGDFSTFKLTTYDGKGAARTAGGDSWFISVREMRQKVRLSARVFDEGDGKYTVAVVLPRPGTYTVFACLASSTTAHATVRLLHYACHPCMSCVAPSCLALGACTGQTGLHAHIHTQT